MIYGSQNMTLSFLTIVLVLVGIVIPLCNAIISDKLVPDFYKSSCPQVENIISDVMHRRSQEDEGIIPGIMRLHFHDCIITGCDGSILLTPMRYNLRNSEINNGHNGVSLRGLNIIHEMKAEIEKQCPGVVSCADILAYAARETVALVGNPRYSIPAGRRDGVVAKGNLANGLPGGNESIEILTDKYKNRGLTVQDLVVLEASHSIGRARCRKSISDPGAMLTVPGSELQLDKQFAANILSKYCNDLENFWFQFTPLNPEKNDTDWGVSFYRNILEGKSVVPCDLGMAVHPSTRPLVQRYASNPDQWKALFNEAMIKVGKINVLTGDEGEIRNFCGTINAVNMTASS